MLKCHLQRCIEVSEPSMTEEGVQEIQNVTFKGALTRGKTSCMAGRL
jgi:hypothetical protein